VTKSYFPETGCAAFKRLNTSRLDNGKVTSQHNTRTHDFSKQTKNTLNFKQSEKTSLGNHIQKNTNVTSQWKSFKVNAMALSEGGQNSDKVLGKKRNSKLSATL